MCAQKGCALGREFTDFGGTLTVTRKLKAAGDGSRNALFGPQSEGEVTQKPFGRDAFIEARTVIVLPSQVMRQTVMLSAEKTALTLPGAVSTVARSGGTAAGAPCWAALGLKRMTICWSRESCGASAIAGRKTGTKERSLAAAAAF